MIRKYGALDQHDPITCPDCVRIVEGTNAAIRLCAAGKNLSARRTATAREANPEIDAVHKMMEAHRSGDRAGLAHAIDVSRSAA